MSEKEIELQSELAVINVPSGAVEMTILFRTIVNGDEVDVFYTYSKQELKEAKVYAEEHVFNDDDAFVITNKGLKYLNGL